MEILLKATLIFLSQKERPKKLLDGFRKNSGDEIDWNAEQDWLLRESL